MRVLLIVNIRSYRIIYIIIIIIMFYTSYLKLQLMSCWSHLLYIFMFIKNSLLVKGHMKYA